MNKHKREIGVDKIIRENVLLELNFDSLLEIAIKVLFCSLVFISSLENMKTVTEPNPIKQISVQ